MDLPDHSRDGLPVAVTLGAASLACLVSAGLPLAAMPRKMYAGMDVFVLPSIPGFILAGNLMNRGGIAGRIIFLANATVGWMRGGLGPGNVAGSMLLGGVSGAAAADAASICGVMIPGMKKAGYPGPFSAAVTAASSTVGPIIPPSVPMIIVGSLSGVSVARMFLAGAVPGVLLGLAMMVATCVIAVRRGFPRQPWMGFCELWVAFKGAFWALAMTALIVGGMLSEVMTPTETAVVAGLCAFVVGVFICRGLPLAAVPKVIADSATSAAAMIGLTTPPVGVCLFICAGIAREPLAAVVRAIIPYPLTNIAALFLVPCVPFFSTWLPGALLD